MTHASAGYSANGRTSPKPLRTVPVAIGAVCIAVYAVFGMYTMNTWGIAAASGLPIESAIEAITTRGEVHSPVFGYVFAAIGMLLAAGWAWSARTRWQTSSRTALASGLAILMLGAPAYFFLSFSNFMAVGDAIPDWQPDAAAVYEAPLYVTSGMCALVLIGWGVSAAVGTRRKNATTDS